MSSIIQIKDSVHYLLGRALGLRDNDGKKSCFDESIWKNFQKYLTSSILVVISPGSHNYFARSFLFMELAICRFLGEGSNISRKNGGIGDDSEWTILCMCHRTILIEKHAKKWLLRANLNMEQIYYVPTSPILLVDHIYGQNGEWNDQYSSYLTETAHPWKTPFTKEILTKLKIWVVNLPRNTVPHGLER